MHTFEFATAKQILFGAGKIKELPEIVRLHGIQRCLVITGRSAERAAGTVELLRKQCAGVDVFSVGCEPTVEIARQGVHYAAEKNCDGVVAVGGGSALDAGKAIASLMRNDGDVLDYLEVIGKGKQLANPSAPWIAIPTTAGTGAEVTSNAVLFAPEQRVKVSLRSPWMLPVAAIVDPELGVGVPCEQTLASGMDALTQLIEAYVSNRANPMTDGFCLQGIPLVARSLQRVCTNGQDIGARTDMSLASLLSGLALANAGLGVVHGFAGPLGGMFDAPHGAICAALLPHGMAANLAHVRSTPTTANATVVGDPSEWQSSQHCGEIIERYRTVAQLLTGRGDAGPEDGVRFVQQLSAELQVPTLHRFGMTAGHASEAVARAQRASSMKKNPVILSLEELEQVYLKAL